MRKPRTLYALHQPRPSSHAFSELVVTNYLNEHEIDLQGAAMRRH